MGSQSFAQRLRALSADWRVLWLLVLLPVALFQPALPIDETRYLAVAWEMHFRGDYLQLHLNGGPYSEKGPLLFWLINFAWLVAGLHVWIVRIGVLAASFASLVLFERLVRRLDPDPRLGSRAAILLAGVISFAVFAVAIMFDALVTTFVLIALHGVLDLDARRWRRGVLLLAAGFGLGLLTKGPVVLLDAGLVALLGPWWSETSRVAKGRWYGAIGLGLLGGLAIALVWALAAYGVHGFWETVVLRQTVGRVTRSFAHARPFWWYFMILPLMLLPWTLTLRASWRTWRDRIAATKASRFGVAWFVPAFVVFCFFSGKQMHYLLPILPGLMIYLAGVLGSPDARLRPRLFGALLLPVGIALALLPYFAANATNVDRIARAVKALSLNESTLRVFATFWPLWGLIAAAIGLWLLLRAEVSAPRLALAGTAVGAAGMLAIAQGVGPFVDVSATAQRIKEIQDSGRPIAHLAAHHGLFELPGRLTQPLPIIDFGHLNAWCAAHPDGAIVTFYTKYPITAKPEQEVPYRFGRITFWRAADILAMPAPTKPVNDDDDSPDD